MPPSETTPKKKAQSNASTVGNGLATFSMHALDKATGAMVAKLQTEETAHPTFGMLGGGAPPQLDPETAARQYLQQALASKAVPSFTAPKTEGAASEYKTIGTETIPLTGTKTVKFRQTIQNIPVYGSLVTVELDDANKLLGLNSSLGEPSGVNSVAKISPADALKAVSKSPGYRKELGSIVPHLYYYFDKQGAKWRMVYILEDVPVTPDAAAAKGAKRMFPTLMDYVVDAQTGKIVAELPRTPTMASAVETAVDGLGKQREIRIETTKHGALLKNTTLNVQTFNFKFGDPEIGEANLPGSPMNRPPSWSPAAVSAHANAEVVSGFMRNVLGRVNIDNKGGFMNSSINCVVPRWSPDGKEWVNAFWNSKQMVYGQRHNGNDLESLSVYLDIVGHEMFHGVTEYTARLEYALQSGALNESYSDIFGVIIANFSNPDTSTWDWQLGEGLGENGNPFRDMSHPKLYGQPDHMKDFVVAPNTELGDYGAVHTNSGIHNKAAYNMLTAKDSAGKLILSSREVAALFYLALTQQLSRTSQFSDSRRAVLTSALTLFRTLPATQQAQKQAGIAKGFSAVGIK